MKNEQLIKFLEKKYGLKKRGIKILIEGKKRELTPDEIAITKSLFKAHFLNDFKKVIGFSFPVISKKGWIDFGLTEWDNPQIIINLK